MNERMVLKMERDGGARGFVPGGVRLWPIALAALLVSVLPPRSAQGMASDGALITNIVSATYGGSGGPSIQYTVSYRATANVLVSCPIVSLAKVAIPTVQAAAGTVTFQVWVSNTSAQASAFGLVITDMLPNNMTYANTLTFWWNGAAPVVTNSNSSNNVAYTAGMPAVGVGSPYYLRWTIDKLAPGRSGFIQYLATVL